MLLTQRETIIQLAVTMRETTLKQPQRPIGSPPGRDGTGRRNHGHNREGECKRNKLYFGTEVFEMEAYAYWVLFERSN